MRVTGLDLSLTATGVARIATGHPPALTTITSKPTGQDTASRAARLTHIRDRIVGLTVGSALVVVEAPTYMSTSGHAHDRSGLWWLVVARLIALRLPVVEVSPTTVKVYAVGKGGGKDAGKDAVLAAVVRRYPDAPVSNNNEADALVLALMGARHLGEPLESNLPTTHLRAMQAVAWPPTGRTTP